MSDLIEFLNQSANVDGMTTGEILEGQGKDDSGFNRTSLLRKLKAEIKAGRVEMDAAWRSRIDGRPSKVPVYRLKK